MSPEQTSLALVYTTCRTCGVALEYQGVGRPPVYCPEHRPSSFPALRPRTEFPKREVACARCGVVMLIDGGPGRPQKYCTDCGPSSAAWRQIAPTLGIDTRAILPRDLRRMRNRYRGRCAYCPAPATTTDHVIPISRGGRHAIGNLVPACLQCNSSKNARLLAEWRFVSCVGASKRREPQRISQLNGGRSGESERVTPHPRHRRTDPPTSVAAAQSVPAGAVEPRIVTAFRQFGWLTDAELVEVVDGYGPTIKSARSRLSKAGVLVDTGVVRKSPRGRDCIVWALAEGVREVVSA